MIRRREGDFDLLITQQEHAALAAKLAAVWGNEKFVRPQRRESVLTAIGMHDDGWREIDEQLPLDSSRRPLEVLDAPPLIAMRAWSTSADRAAAADAYAGLLVSLHGLALSVKAAMLRPPPANPSDVQFLTEQFEVNKFLHREIERQEQLRSLVGMRTDLPLTQGLADAGASPQEDRLTFDLRVLQTTDAASLLLCGEPEDRIRGIQLQPAPTAPPMAVKFDYDRTGQLRMKPWPFDVRRLEFQLTAKALPRRTFADAEECRAAVEGAESRGITVSIAPM